MDKIQGKIVRYWHQYDAAPDEQHYYNHKHGDFFEILIVLRGEAEFIVENFAYELGPLSLCFVRPGVFHNLRLKTKEPYERIVINFNEDAVLPEIRHRLSFETNVFRLSESSEIIKAIARADRDMERYHIDDRQIMLELTLNDFLLRLCYLSNRMARPQTMPPAVSAIIDYVNKNINEPMDVMGIAKELYLSRAYISHLFSRHMNISLIDYINQKKILLAQKLLRGQNKPMEVAAMCGYTTYTTFYRLYKKMLGITPEQERQMNENK